MNLNRRDILQKLMMGLAVVPAMGALTACGKKEEPAPAAPAEPAPAAPAAPAEPAPAAAAPAGDMPEGLPALDEADPTASALGYKADGSTVDVAKYPKKGEANGASQSCETCALYVTANHAVWGKCSVFPGKLVSNKGWCNSWAAKQG